MRIVLCAWAYVCAPHARRTLGWSEEEPGTGVRGSCVPSLRSWEQTQALYKSGKYSQPLRHLSSPYASLNNWSPEEKTKYPL